MKKQQTGGTIVGFIVGVIVGLGAALAVAVYVTKVPVPFLNKGNGRGADLDAAESQKNKNWDPNSPLYGKNPARPAAPASRRERGVRAATIGAAGPAHDEFRRPPQSRRPARHRLLRVQGLRLYPRRPLRRVSCVRRRCGCFLQGRSLTRLVRRMAAHCG